MAKRYTRRMGNLPVVPYREPEPWVPSGGFGQFRTPEEQERDARLAAEHDEAEQAEESEEPEEPEEPDPEG
jgi:hypothetical protein